MNWFTVGWIPQQMSNEELMIIYTVHIETAVCAWVVKDVTVLHAEFDTVDLFCCTQ